MTNVLVADCLIAIAMLVAESFDAIITDPPYHLTQASRGGSARKEGTGPFGRHRVGSKGFMGKTWDGGGVAFRVELWEGRRLTLSAIVGSATRSIARTSTTTIGTGHETLSELGAEAAALEWLEMHGL